MHIKFDIITAFPQMFTGPLTESIVKIAIKKKIIDLTIHNLRDYTTDKHQKIDDKPYGENAGMVLMIEPIANCIRMLKNNHNYDEIIYMAPDGELLTQKIANELSTKTSFIVLCGHYKGIDQRVRDLFVTREISIGDYVLSGGELPAAVLVDTITRIIPGTVSNETSTLTDSFQDDLIAYPVYTKPSNFEGVSVPEVLLSGNHKEISKWKDNEAIKKTKEKRPLLNSFI
jgi:tRNA (guanine37-N1)-methyltransferase